MMKARTLRTNTKMRTAKKTSQLLGLFSARTLLKLNSKMKRSKVWKYQWHYLIRRYVHMKSNDMILKQPNSILQKLQLLRIKPNLCFLPETHLAVSAIYINATSSIIKSKITIIISMHALII
jgi:hypothetical protein